MTKRNLHQIYDLEELRGIIEGYEEAQERLTEYADSLEEVGVFIHRDLGTLPKEYVEVVNSYLKEGVENIKQRELVEGFELKYEKARGELFDCVHERDLLSKELSLYRDKPKDGGA